MTRIILIVMIEPCAASASQARPLNGNSGGTPMRRFFLDTPLARAYVPVGCLHTSRSCSMSIQMELSKIIISEMQDQQIIVLKEVDGDRKFPIVIGSGEAYAIERRLKGVVAPRPLTHELLASVIEQLGGSIERIEINNLQDHT